ncbi:MAG: hypothetical protein IJZ83_11065 [Clostridia bacterium]|nr:hypothetical protein [Clostridia bacterium]
MFVHLINSTLTPTAAYLDPSTATVIITSISGVVVALSATAVILFRKAKRKVAKTLHIDENANKEVESDIELKDVDEDDED